MLSTSDAQYVSVMRLTRPTLSSPVIVTCETKDLPGNLFNTSLKNDITSVSGGESLAVGQFLLVPQSFGSVTKPSSVKVKHNLR